MTEMFERYNKYPLQGGKTNMQTFQSFFKDKRGEMPIRVIGTSTKSIFGVLLIGVGLSVAAMAGVGLWNKWISPSFDAWGITSSVAGTNAQPLIQQIPGVTQEIIVNDNLGDTSALTINVMDREANSLTEITPNLRLYDDSGLFLVDQL